MAINAHISKYKYRKEYNFANEFLLTFEKGDLNQLDKYFLNHDTFDEFITAKSVIDVIKKYDYYVYKILPLDTRDGVVVVLNRKDKKEKRWLSLLLRNINGNDYIDSITADEDFDFGQLEKASKQGQSESVGQNRHEIE